MKSKFYIKLIFSFLIFCFCLVFGTYSIVHKEFYGGILLCVLVGLFMLFLIIQQIKNRFDEVDKILLAIKQKDFTLFPNENQKGMTLKSAVDLYYQIKKEHNQLSAYQHLYQNILDKLEIGIIILQIKEEIEDSNVFYVNPKLLEILEVPKYKHWSFYEEKIPEFYKIVNERVGEDSQYFLDISIDSSVSNVFSLRSSNLKTVDYGFCIITLESVQSIVEKKEKLAWNNLMRVISHELMNTLTPVNSLIDNLKYIAEQDEINKEDHDEMRESLNVIHSKSEQLMSFIQDYRQVAELPKPVKAIFNLKETIENVVKLMQPEFDKNEIVISTDLDEIEIDADEKMIERVLINLLTNAIFSFDNQELRQININLKLRQNRIVLQVEDSGSGIDDKIKDKIFMPFFTTRKHGSGIGLTLSKSIIEAHKGYISYKSNKNGSLFEIVFLG